MHLTAIAYSRNAGGFQGAMFVPEILQENLQEEMMSNASAAITWSKKRRCGMGAEVAGVCAIVLTIVVIGCTAARRQAWQAHVKRKFTKFCRGPTIFAFPVQAVLLKYCTG